ncbi:hypothetical protein IW262DRAFT_1456564 [Armillaria fumosa]|nr:hypothetical protein IW262DRAFT_1456564 [Armillaria fumosa]
MSLSLNPPNTDTTTFKVAAIQAEPAWCDLQGGVDKTIRIIREASSEGLKSSVFRSSSSQAIHGHH